MVQSGMEDGLNHCVQTFHPCKVTDAHCAFDREVDQKTTKAHMRSVVSRHIVFNHFRKRENIFVRNKQHMEMNRAYSIYTVSGKTKPHDDRRAPLVKVY